jgi:hypothetical protein
MKNGNLVRSGFKGFIPLIIVVTTLQAVNYSGDSTSFATYLTGLAKIKFLTATTIAMI